MNGLDKEPNSDSSVHGLTFEVDALALDVEGGCAVSTGAEANLEELGVGEECRPSRPAVSTNNLCMRIGLLRRFGQLIFVFGLPF